MLFSITNNYVRHACRCVCAAEKLSLELYLLSQNISYFIARLLSSVLGSEFAFSGSFSLSWAGDLSLQPSCTLSACVLTKSNRKLPCCDPTTCDIDLRLIWYGQTGQFCAPNS